MLLVDWRKLNNWVKIGACVVACTAKQYHQVVCATNTLYNLHMASSLTMATNPIYYNICACSDPWHLSSLEAAWRFYDCLVASSPRSFITLWFIRPPPLFHSSREQIEVFIRGMFELSKDLHVFKNHMRDFLVQLKVLANKTTLLYPSLAFTLIPAPRYGICSRPARFHT